tara:strand:+ start:362 stop:631 length:270 start_codon:yes stop_codon:yes gene_type:complete
VLEVQEQQQVLMELQQLELVAAVVVLVMVHQDVVLFQEDQEALVEVVLVVHIQEDKEMLVQLIQVAAEAEVLMDQILLQQLMVALVVLE